MKSIALYIMLTQAILCCVSCEKDFIYDEDCHKEGSEIGGWEEQNDTTIHEKKDTINGGFYIEVNEWGDTIQKNIPI